MIKTYMIGYDEAEDLDYIYCIICGTSSYHPEDIADKLCPHCDKSHEQLGGLQ